MSTRWSTSHSDQSSRSSSGKPFAAKTELWNISPANYIATLLVLCIYVQIIKHGLYSCIICVIIFVICLSYLILCWILWNSSSPPSPQIVFVLFQIQFYLFVVFRRNRGSLNLYLFSVSHHKCVFDTVSIRDLRWLKLTVFKRGWIVGGNQGFTLQTWIFKQYWCGLRPCGVWTWV